MGLNVILPLVGGLAVVAVLAIVILVKNRTAYLGPVREELQKEKAWLRRGEYNAAMVRGRQNLELLLKLVAEKNGIQLDNSAKAQEEAERQNQNGRKKTSKVMTHHQFNRWLSENGYIDRVARWELNQVRIIGNKAVHENYADKDDAWNQFNYLEDVLKTITERSQNPKKRQEQAKQQKQDEVQKKQPRRKPQENKQEEKPQLQSESEQAEQAPKKKKRRKKKSAQQKQNAQEVKETIAAETPQTKQKKKAQPVKVQQEPPQEEQAVEKKKPRRRRRRKKPQNPQVQTEVVKPVETVKAEKPTKSEPKKSEPMKSEPKKSNPEKEPTVTNDGEQKQNPHKRRRRRRPRKPQTAQGQNSSGE